MKKLSLEIKIEEKTQQIIMSGELNGHAALEFRQKITSVLEDQSEWIVLDLQDLKALDLIGFNALVMVKSIAENRKKSFSMVISDNSPIVEYLHLSKLHLNQTIAAS